MRDIYRQCNVVDDILLDVYTDFRVFLELYNDTEILKIQLVLKNPLEIQQLYLLGSKAGAHSSCS